MPLPRQSAADREVAAFLDARTRELEAEAAASRAEVAQAKEETARVMAESRQRQAELELALDRVQAEKDEQERAFKVCGLPPSPLAHRRRTHRRNGPDPNPDPDSAHGPGPGSDYEERAGEGGEKVARKARRGRLGGEAAGGMVSPTRRSGCS